VADMIGASLEEDQNLVGNKSGEPYIKYVFHNKPLSDYDCAEYFLRSFPTLFWTGKGGHLEKRSPHVSYSMWIRYLLNHHSRRFAQHPWFMFVAFNVHVRRLSTYGARLITKRKSWPKVRRNLASLSRSDLEVAAKELQEGHPISNKKAWTVINNIEAIGKNVPLSNQQRQMMRRDAFRIIIWNGQPSIWLTINLNDIGNPLCCIVAGVRIPLKISSVMRKKIRRITASGSRGMEARSDRPRRTFHFAARAPAAGVGV